jgi:hypothetical protein
MSEFQTIFKDKSIQQFNPYSQRIFKQLSICHTAQKGVHKIQCSDSNCTYQTYQYHACGNRHCPHCGGFKREEWIENRMQEVLPTAYYHLVFTLPHELNSLIMGNRKKLFKLLFDSASQTILQHANMPEYLGAECGITMILHTWGQDLSFHPHVHCIVTAGGYDGQKWIDAKRKKNNFLFPEKSLQKMYKAKFLDGIAKLNLQTETIDYPKVIKEIGFKKWNVYAKSPFGGPAQVVEYVGRYTHKIAITKHRIIKLTDTDISFRYKDYADGGTIKTMTLKREEFLRRFEQHFLPAYFTKIRHYGFLQNYGKFKRLVHIRELLKLSPIRAVIKIPVEQRILEKFGKDITKCPCCKIGKLEIVYTKRYGKQMFTNELINKIGFGSNKEPPVATK